MNAHTQIDIKAYREFLLLADPVKTNAPGNRQISVRVVESPAGESYACTQSIPDGFQTTLRYLENRQLNISEIKDFGKTLADILFPASIRYLLISSRNGLQPAEGLRLRLQLHHSLFSIPWEYLYIEELNGFIALQPRISIVRHETVSTPTGIATTTGPRRLLVAMASPSNGTYNKLDLATEWQNLQEALHEVPDLTIGRPEGQNFQSFTDELQKGADIVHFAGHGDFRKTGLGADPHTSLGEGELIFATDNGAAEPISAEQFAIRLGDRSVGLVVLGACQTGRRDGENMWSSVVAALVKKGIPGVIAMQYKIWDKSAVAFMRGFYRALASGLPLDWAVTEGRQAVYDLCNPKREDLGCGKYWRDWGVPVLYLRGKSGTQPINSEPIQRGLKALKELLQKSEIRGASRFRDDFKKFYDHIETVTDYKELHDLLQDLEKACYEPIQQVASNYPQDDRVLEFLEVCAGEMQVALKKLQVIANHGNVPPRRLEWKEYIEDAHVKLESAIDTQQPDALAHVISFLRRALSFMSVINDYLVQAALDLEFNNLVNAVETIDIQLSAMDARDSDQVTRFRRGAETLSLLAQQFADQIEEHDRWQLIDLDLQSTEKELVTDLSQLTLFWPRLQKKISLMFDQTDSWAEKLIRFDQELGTALNASEPDDKTIRRCFRKYCREARCRFRIVNLTLLELCRELSKLRNPLNDVIIGWSQ